VVAEEGAKTFEPPTPKRPIRTTKKIVVMSRVMSL
jgi:hypothetical protein